VGLFGNAAYNAGVVKLTTNANSLNGSMVVADLDSGAPIQSFAARFRYAHRRRFLARTA
jgi:hypothetical protein